MSASRETYSEAAEDGQIRSLEGNPYTRPMPLTLTWTRRALKLPQEVRDELTSRLEKLHPFFPEMTPVMKVGITRFYDGLAFMSDSGKVRLWVNVHRRRKGGWVYPTHWTLAHEMMHLAQFNDDRIPSGERACDVFTLARLSPRLIDDSPSYLVITQDIRDDWSDRHSKLAHELAKEGIRLRNDGLRKYASWWEDEFEKRILAEAPPKKKPRARCK